MNRTLKITPANSGSVGSKMKIFLRSSLFLKALSFRAKNSRIKRIKEKSFLEGVPIAEYVSNIGRRAST